MSSVIVENIVLTGEWICDAEVFERAKKARLLPDDVWRLIKSYAIPLNKCATCSKISSNEVGGKTYCLPNFRYKARFPKLECGGRELMIRNREKLTDDDVVIEKKIGSVWLCWDCSFKWVRDGGKHTGIFFYRSSITDRFIYAFDTVCDLFQFHFEKMYPLNSHADKKQLSARTRNLKKLKDPLCDHEYDIFLNQLHSSWVEYVKEEINNEEEDWRGQVELWNSNIDDYIKDDIEEQISDKYKGLILKTIATAFVIGKLDMKNYMEITTDIIPKYRVCRTEEEGIEKIKQLEEISGIKL